jgi:molybdenum cofactor cytidylyltransferase
VGLILSGSRGAREKVEASFANALAQRLDALGSHLERTDYASIDEEGGEDRLVELLREHRRAGYELLVLAGETAIQDRHDIAPRAVERAGGRVECFGAPVDPGNLLLLAELDGVSVLGAPGCARSPKTNIIDLLLPRLLVGDRLSRADVAAFGHGGLLEDVPERPLPRSRV